MLDLDEKFFREKRPWSVIKDKVLGEYMTPYLAKVARLNKQILLVDGYAGPGVFDDHTLGSPLIMCAAAEKMVKGRYTALFMNHDIDHHKKLDEILIQQGWRSRAIPVLGDSKIFLNELSDRLRDQTVFLYLDPYGLKGCEFATLEPFLRRDERYSTEIVINISMPITHRLAARHATAEGRANERVFRYHQRLTQVFGGEYWKDIMWSTSLEPEEKEFALIREYRRLLSGYLHYVGSCPVQESKTARVKYFITFVSRHPDAMLLMNDAMCKAYFQQMHEAEYTNTLFASIDWKTMRDSVPLDKVILEEIKQNPGSTRAELWLTIVQSHFMKFTEPEYKKSIEKLVLEQNKVYTPTPRKTKKLNDDCKLYLVEN